MDRLRELMFKHKMSQAKLAEKLNLSTQSVHLKINGAREFTQSELVSIADIFQVTVDYLLERED